MTEIAVFDSESDGFVEEATIVWCYYGTDSKGKHGTAINVTNHTDVAKALAEYFEKLDFLICHNIIGHDAPLIDKLSSCPPIDSSKFIDTLILSKMFFPDIKGGAGKPHSLAAWGERFNRPKPEHEDWSKYSPDMEYRLREDQAINLRLYQLLESKGWRLPE